jgi:hypothetical protein
MTETTQDMDHGKLDEFLGRFVGDLAATGSAGGVVIGSRLGLYRALARGAATAEHFAERTGCDRRYLTEWLRGQAAAGYITYDPPDGGVLPHPGAGVLPRRPERARPARGVPHRARLPARRAAHHRGVPHG